MPVHFADGTLYRHRAIWPRTDFFSHPECSPPGHGSVAYCEMDLVWHIQDLDKGYGMFQYFADSEYSDGPPTRGDQADGETDTAHGGTNCSREAPAARGSR